jgi:hypothetical protein
MATMLGKAAGAAGAVVLTCAASVALADVTVQQRISVEGAGMMSAANMSGTTKTIISGDRSRTDSDIQLQSRIVRMLAHRAVGPSAEIVRLDQDRIDRLDITRKQYTETTFEELKTRLQKAMDKAQDSQTQGQEGPKPMDDSKCEWLEPKADVKRTGEKATYGGFEAERLTIVASQPCKDKETGAICEVALALDEWLAPKFTAREEEEKFHRAYAQKIGLDLTSGPRGGGGPFGGGDINQRAQSMFGRYSGIWSEIASKTKDAKGYPVKTSFSFAFGGTECKNAKGQQAQQGSSDDNSSGGPGGLAGQMAGKLGSLFHRKKDDSQTDTGAAASPGATPPAVTLPNGLVPIITMTSELVSVSTDSVSSTTFDVPSDFKKVERQGD